MNTKWNFIEILICFLGENSFIKMMLNDFREPLNFFIFVKV